MTEAVAHNDWSVFFSLAGEQLDGKINYHTKHDPNEVEQTTIHRRDGGLGFGILNRTTGLEMLTTWGLEAYQVGYFHSRFDPKKTSDLHLKFKTSGSGDDVAQGKIPATLFGGGKLTWNLIAPAEKNTGLINPSHIRLPIFSPIFDQLLPWFPNLAPYLVVSPYVEYKGAVAPKRVDVSDFYTVDTHQKRLELARVAPVLLDSPYYRSSMYFAGTTLGLDTHGLNLPVIEAASFNITGAFVLLDQAIYYDFRPKADKVIGPYLKRGDDFNSTRARFLQKAGWGTFGLDIFLTKSQALLVKAMDIFISPGRTKVNFSFASVTFQSTLFER